MNLTTSSAGCGAILGLVAVLLAQQLGALPLSEAGPAAVWILLGILLGGVIFGEAGWLVDHP